MNPYKESNNLIRRQTQSKNVLAKYYPYKVPVIIQKHKREQILNPLTKQKFLIPMDMNQGQLLYIIRNRLMLNNNNEIAIFMCTESGTMLSSTDLISQVYDKHKDEKDDFLYLFYCGENTFG